MPPSYAADTPALGDGVADGVALGVAGAVAPGVGVSPLPYPSGGEAVVRVDHATTVAGTATDGAVPQSVKVTVFTVPSL